MRLAFLLLDPLLALAPVVLLLLGLIYLDSFKLVRAPVVLAALLAGAGAALAASWVNGQLIDFLAWKFALFTRYGAPLTEESLKAAPLVVLLARNRIGFPVDAAIYGFAVGTGFAVVENVNYLRDNPQSPEIVWAIRGFGTALLHGGTAAVFAILARVGADRSRASLAAAMVPGWLAAVVIHSFYNHFFLSPLPQTLLILLTLPFLVGALFLHSERLLRAWLTQGFDAAAEMIQLLDSGRFHESRVGRYLERLQGRFSGEVVADMLCFLRLHTELSLRAKGALMLREQGFEPSRDAEVEAKLKELDYLSANVGKTGMRALQPFLGEGSRDLWQLFLLGKR